MPVIHMKLWFLLVFLLFVSIATSQDSCNASTSCGPSETCCPMRAHHQFCCPFYDAICCPDTVHCCPPGFRCDPAANGMCLFLLRGKVMKATRIITRTDQANVEEIKDPFKGFEYAPLGQPCPNHRQMCKDNQTCCPLSDGNFGCCPLQGASCCPDFLHCCPHGTECTKEGACMPAGKIPAITSGGF